MNEIATYKPSYQVAKRIEVLEIPEVKEKLSETEYSIAKLATGRTIREMPDKDLQIINNEPKDRGLVFMAGMLAKGIAKDFSIRNIDQSEGYRFFDILKKYYSGFTLEEVRAAFELALVGELDTYLPKDRNGAPDKGHFQSFSVEFVTKILNAYKIYKGKVWGKVYLIEGKQEVEVTEEEKKEIEENFLIHIQSQYDDWEQGKPTIFMFPVSIADYLMSRGFVEDRELEQQDFNKALLNIKNVSNLTGLEKSRIFETFSEGNYHERLRSEAIKVKSQDLILKAFENIKTKGKKIYDTNTQ